MKRKVLAVFMSLSVFFAYSISVNAQNTDIVENRIITKTSDTTTLIESEELNQTNITIPIIVGVLGGTIISFAVTSGMKNSMKTARKQKEATNYIRQGSFTVRESYDRYLYQDTVRVKKEEKNNNS